MAAVRAQLLSLRPAKRTMVESASRHALCHYRVAIGVLPLWRRDRIVFIWPISARWLSMICLQS